ncbi:MAG: hypothetical protein NC313_13985 [Butyrivibrio sp.]|nr:hypothetical protein [Butyrivibrio sp.]
MEVPYINPDIGLVLLSVRQNLNEYFYEDIKYLAYITNSLDDLEELIRKSVTDKYKDVRDKKLEYYLRKKNKNYIDSFVQDIKNSRV